MDTPEAFLDRTGAGDMEGAFLVLLDGRDEGGGGAGGAGATELGCTSRERDGPGRRSGDPAGRVTRLLGSGRSEHTSYYQSQG